jgi:hypothetical protein
MNTAEPKPLGQPDHHDVVMGVRRSPKTEESRFARIDNAVLQNSSLSFRARGLLACVLSMPEVWRHSAESLANPAEGKHAVRAALQELTRAGHARLLKVRNPRGCVVSCWRFSEVAEPEAPGHGNAHSAAPAPGLPESVEPGAGLPESGRPESGSPKPGRTELFETTMDETTISKQAPSGAERGKSKSRRRDPLLDALAGLGGVNLAEVTPSAWGAAAKALADIRSVCPAVTPEEIQRRAARYREKMPKGSTLSASALAKHWANCAPRRTDPAEPTLRTISAA